MGKNLMGPLGRKELVVEKGNVWMGYLETRIKGFKLWRYEAAKIEDLKKFN